jgi:hypothetical protein
MNIIHKEWEKRKSKRTAIKDPSPAPVNGRGIATKKSMKQFHTS